jgi:hypothetical protein
LVYSFVQRAILYTSKKSFQGYTLGPCKKLKKSAVFERELDTQDFCLVFGLHVKYNSN